MKLTDTGLKKRMRMKNLLKIVSGMVLASAVILTGCSLDNQTADIKAEPRAAVTMQQAFENISGAPAKKFTLKDSAGGSMDCLQIVPDGNAFLGVYHVDSGGMTVFLATSTDLMNWTRVRQLSAQGEASQPYLYKTGNAFILGWEREAGVRTVVLRYFTSRANLVANVDDGRRFNAPIPFGSWIGTPNIYSGSSTSVDVGFHYYNGSVDREGRGTTNWSSWTSASQQTALDNALTAKGMNGNHGSRDNNGVLEAQGTRGDWGSWRVFGYSGSAVTQYNPVTPKGSKTFANPHVTSVTINGRAAWVFTAFIHPEGNNWAQGEQREAIWYNYKQ